MAGEGGEPAVDWNFNSANFMLGSSSGCSLAGAATSLAIFLAFRFLPILF